MSSYSGCCWAKGRLFLSGKGIDECDLNGIVSSTFVGGGEVDSLAVSWDERFIAVGCLDGTARVFRVHFTHLTIDL